MADDDGGGGAAPAELLPPKSIAPALRLPDSSRRPWDSSPSASAWYLRLCALGTVVIKAPLRFQSRVTFIRRQQMIHTWVWPDII
jgi:hypothetical protein